jgi:transcription antitermination protein NusB
VFDEWFLAQYGREVNKIRNLGVGKSSRKIRWNFARFHSGTADGNLGVLADHGVSIICNCGICYRQAPRRSPRYYCLDREDYKQVLGGIPLSRRLARETALQVLFQRDLTKEHLMTSTEIQRWSNEFEIPESSKVFAQELVDETIAHMDEIDKTISSFAQDWAIKRMANVDRNVMRLATYEILFRPDIPGRVSLNEAIELAKRFGGEESAKFVNGILDRIVDSVAKGDK